MNKPQQSFLIEHGGELDEMMLGSLVKKIMVKKKCKRIKWVVGRTQVKNKRDEHFN